MKNIVKLQIAEAARWCEINLQIADVYAKNSQQDEAKQYVERAEDESAFAFSLSVQK